MELLLVLALPVWPLGFGVWTWSCILDAAVARKKSHWQGHGPLGPDGHRLWCGTAPNSEKGKHYAQSASSGAAERCQPTGLPSGFTGSYASIGAQAWKE